MMSMLIKLSFVRTYLASVVVTRMPGGIWASACATAVQNHAGLHPVITPTMRSTTII